MNLVSNIIISKNRLEKLISVPCLGILLGISILGVSPSAGDPVLGPEKVISNQNLDEFNPVVVLNTAQSEYLIVWHDESPRKSRSIMGKRVDLQGITLATFVIASNPSRDNAQPSVAYDPMNDRYLVTWIYDYHGDGTDWDIHGRIVPWQGPSSAFPSFSINENSSPQWEPRVAHSGSNGFMVTWWNEGSAGGTSAIAAQRIDSIGRRVGGPISVSAGSEERVGPDITYDGLFDQYLIVYQRMTGGGDIYLVRLRSNGSMVPGGEIAVANWPDAELNPQVAASFSLNHYAVVWESVRSSGHGDIFARRFWFDITGAVHFHPPSLIKGTPGNEAKPSIAPRRLHGDYLIAWEQQYNNLSGPYGIHARSLDVSGVLGAEVTMRPVYLGSHTRSRRPSIAGWVYGWLVVWEQERNDPWFTSDINGRSLWTYP